MVFFFILKFINLEMKNRWIVVTLSLMMCVYCDCVTCLIGKAFAFCRGVSMFQNFPPRFLCLNLLCWNKKELGESRCIMWVCWCLTTKSSLWLKWINFWDQYCMWDGIAFLYAEFEISVEICYAEFFVHVGAVISLCCPPLE